MFGRNEGKIHPIQLAEITFLDNQDHKTLSSRLNDLSKNYEIVVHRKATLGILGLFF